MKRLYGHIAWFNTETGEFVTGRALCGKRVSRPKPDPMFVCGVCAAMSMRTASRPLEALFRVWTVPPQKEEP